MNAPPAELSLDGDGWRFHGFLGDGWRRARLGEPQPGWLPGRVPGSVVDDLWYAGELADPQVGRNSLAAEWVADRHWAYQRTFACDPGWAGGRVELQLDGIDPAARLFLNGQPLGRHRGTFVPARRDVTRRVRWDAENALTVVLEPSPPSEPQIGDTRRVRVHRPRMTYGWDFCPRLPHQGVWDAVRLRATGSARIDDLWVRTATVQSGAGRIVARAALDCSVPSQVELSMGVTLAGVLVASRREARQLPAGASAAELQVEVEEPARWWPNAAGEQPLYRARLEAVVGDAVADTREVTFGFRDVAWEPNEQAPPGSAPHTLVVNGRRIWIRGWNWVPVDVCYGVPNTERVEHLVDLARRSGANLLRVWGGGLIERESFYAACDRAGIMVWQEFSQSSSGIVDQPSRGPAWRRLLAREAEAIVPRRRNHPSLVAWCGGNELARPDRTPCDDGEPALAALREMVARLDPDRGWFATSPTGSGELHGPWEHQGIGRHEGHHDGLSPTLHSEFGVEGAANQATLEAAIPAERRVPIDRSNPEWRHRGEWWLNVPLVRAAFGDLIHSDEQLLDASRFLQASGLAYAVDANARRAWRTSGAIPWQLNEPFANGFCTSVVDRYGRPKPGWSAVAESYRPLALSARYVTQAWGANEHFEAEIWAASRLPHVARGEWRAWCVAMDGGVFGSERGPAQVPPDASQRLGRVSCDLARPRRSGDEPFLLVLELADTADGVVADRRYVFSAGLHMGPLLTAPGTLLRASRFREPDADDPAARGEDWSVRLRNSGDAVALLVRLEDGRPANGSGWAIPAADLVCLLPGEERRVGVTWRGVPPQERRLRVRGWNTGELSVG